MKNDFLSELRECLRAYYKMEKELIATNPTLCESEMENYSDSYIWLRFPMPDEYLGMVSDMILSGVEELPNTCLAGILVGVLKNRVPKEIEMSGMSIDRVGSSFHFCISGSASLGGLRTLCEQYESNHGLEG